ncbi:MAG TPA: glycoside hydrolase family 5 protein [Gemmatimonadaceae bacterium]|nr:glycoside hydrolase family 5 protein [Gemmatimonadaceae bacterium]
MMRPVSTRTGRFGLYPTGVQMRGINVAGAEYGCDWGGFNNQTFFKWPTDASWATRLPYLAGKGFNCIRLPISWERLQHNLLGAFSPTYQANLLRVVKAASAYGFYTMVDLHNYNRYATNTHVVGTDTQTAAGAQIQQIFGDAVLTNAHVIDVWEKLAALFKNDNKVSFNLMNESHDFTVTSDNYVTNINAQIAAIRAVGANNLILVPNSRASDVDHWQQYSPNGGPFDSVAFVNITDSAKNYAFDMHAYWIPGSTPARYTSYANLLSEVTAWARTNKRRLFLSEIGVNEALADGATQVQGALAYMNDNADVWLGWTPWDLTPYRLTDATEQADGVQMPRYAATLTANTVRA